MNLITYIKAQDLIAWADRIDAPPVLPSLVRQLIYGTTQTLTRVSFPADEGIRRAGWDGWVEASSPSAFVPEGPSGWEVSTNADVKGKADSDYEARTGKIGDPERSATTFIFVTPRRWSGKRAWEEAKKRDGRWKDVRVFDADDLAEWLERAPAVHAWFSLLVNKHPGGVLDLATAWGRWSSVTQPRFSPDLLTAGRAGAAERVRNWLVSSEPVLTIASDSPSESLYFVVAVIAQLPESECDYFQSRSLIVSDPSALAALGAIEEPLFLFMQDMAQDVVAQAVSAGHKVIIPAGAEHEPRPGCVAIPRVNREEARQALLRMGFGDTQANDLAGKARRSILSLWRRLSTIPEIRRPAWALEHDSDPIIAAFLVGGWNESDEADCEVLAAIAGKSYKDLRPRLLKLSKTNDPPIRRVGDRWTVISREDVWPLIRDVVRADQLDRFHKVAVELLAAPDPKYDLDPDRQFAAALYGKIPRGTNDLRAGVCATLALIGSDGGHVISRGKTARDWVCQIVEDVLAAANQDWRVWASRWSVLGLLAEAAPDQFLAAVEQGCKEPEPLLRRLFTDSADRSSVFASSPHVGLLFALETLAWSPDYVSRAVLVLGRLAVVDPGGTRGNRPQESLRQIFLPWHTQTAATPDEQWAIIGLLRRHVPTSAWHLMVDLLPKSHDSAHGTARPRWRDWIPDVLPRSNRYALVPRLLEAMLEDVGPVADRWVDLIDAMPDLPPPDRATIVDRLALLEPTTLAPVDRVAVCAALRTVISNHRAFPDAAWSLPEPELKRLEDIYHQLEPDELPDRFAWLFSNDPKTLSGRREYSGLFTEDVEALRAAAVEAFLDAGGVNALIQFASTLEWPAYLGIATGKSDALSSKDEADVLDCLAASDASLALFGRGFLHGRFSTRGAAWVGAQLLRTDRTWPDRSRAELFLVLPALPVTWEAVAAAGPGVEQCYWAGYPLGTPSERSACEHAAKKLVAYGRPYTAASTVAMYLSHTKGALEPEIVLDVLEGALSTDPSDDRTGMEAFHIQQLLGYVAASDLDRGRVARVEYGFLPLHTAQGWVPVVLHEELSRNPAFFVEVVQQAYRSSTAPKRRSSKQAQDQARRAHQLLESWDRLPGSDGAAAPETDAIMAWVAAARELLAASGRGVIGDQLIGQALSHSPCGADGAWPAKCVREVIERLGSDHLETGIDVGVANGRSVYTKSLYEGGLQERELAGKYAEWGQSLRIQWPRTAALLKRISSRYERDARREDEAAEVREDSE